MNLPLAELAERRSFLDPHGGKQSPRARIVQSGLARAAIVDVARDQWNRFWVLDAWADRSKTDTLVQKLIEHHSRWHPAIFGIDSTAQQSLFVDTVRTILRMKGLSNIVVEGVPASTRMDKLYRVRTILQPIIVQRRLFIANHLFELKAELLAFPTGRTVDLVDALAGAISLFPPAITHDEQSEAGDESYASFLRECGLNEDEISARLSEEYDADEDYGRFNYGRQKRF